MDTAMNNAAHKEGMKAGWRSPSNIALIKYWGKKEGQIPANPSFSMTLSESYTETRVSCTRNPVDAGQALKFTLEGRSAAAFEDKITGYLASVGGHLPYIQNQQWEIDSRNTFPHAAGIASSASGFSALALCLVSLEQETERTTMLSEGQLAKDQLSEAQLRRASFLARLGSGSACRSVYGGFALWGKTPLVDGSDDSFAIPAGHLVHRSFHDLHDAIMIVSSKEKKVSSRAGHGLMGNHPFARQRYLQAGKNLESLLQGLISGDWEVFVKIVESEALSLHAMMMTSDPAFLLVEPGTLEIISKIREFREDTGIPVCFTLDAGPNIHLLYPGEDRDTVRAFITGELLVYCEQNRWLDDHIGEGPERMN
jgi:diphosphomevalonate decarboxylase